jgi:hypothetical protein
MVRFPASRRDDFEALKKLDSPSKIQDFLNRMPANFERQGETCRSPLMVLRHREAHCMEGAMLGAAALWYHGEPPLLLDLKTTSRDDDHVVVLFKQGGRWGAISKTNHAVLRYRDAIYAHVRELAMSYFNEYFLDDGVKTLRSYSAPFDLLQYENEWLASKEDVWGIPRDLDRSRHFKILRPSDIRRLRRADAIEIEAGKIVQWKKD